MKKGILLGSCFVILACSHQQDTFDQRIETAIKLCQSDTTKAYSYTDDGLRIMCQDGSSYIIRGDMSIDDIASYDENYCVNMGIRDFVVDPDGKIKLTCKDKSSYILKD